MISYNIKGDNFSDVIESKMQDIGIYYFKRKDNINIKKLIINNTMGIECDDPELQINMYRSTIILYPFDPNLVPGCGVECYFDKDINLEIKVESIGATEMHGNLCYVIYLDITEVRNNG